MKQTGIGERNKLLEKRSYLYLTEFFSGMSVMAVELGASRLLAPYFSSSQIVWTIIIATIMIAMALGNVWGGRAADRDPDPDRLYFRLILAGVWTAMIPLLGKYVILGISGALVLTVNANFLTLAAFCACMVIFVFPCFLLGTVTPSLVKYAVDSLEDSGRTVGNLNAFNTTGSIIGTFLPTFVTIPAVGTSVTFLIFSGILLFLGLVYFFFCRRRKLLCITGVLLFAAASFFGNSDSFAFWEKNLAYEGESIYNYLQVKEQPDRVILSTNVLFGVQSVAMKKDALTGMYYDYAMAAPVFSAEGKSRRSEQGAPTKKEIGRQDMLILGMGTGTYAKQCLRHFGKMNIEGVEIDRKISSLADRYFDQPKSAKVVNYDGRAYLQAVKKKYDVIMVDAYQDITIPFQMSSREFFTMVRDHLKPGGVMVVNMNMRGSGHKGITDYLSDTIASVFSSVQICDVRGNTNRELFASMGKLNRDDFYHTVSCLKDQGLRDLLMEVHSGLRSYRGGNLILTDDKAPVELLGMKAIDSLIADELGYYKKLFREEGLRGVLADL